MKNESNWIWVLIAMAIILSPLLPPEKKESKSIFSFIFSVLWRLLLVGIISFLIFCTGFGIYNLFLI